MVSMMSATVMEAKMNGLDARFMDKRLSPMIHVHSSFWIIRLWVFSCNGSFCLFI